MKPESKDDIDPFEDNGRNEKARGVELDTDLTADDLKSW